MVTYYATRSEDSVTIGQDLREFLAKKGIFVSNPELLTEEDVIAFGIYVLDAPPDKRVLSAVWNGETIELVLEDIPDPPPREIIPLPQWQQFLDGLDLPDRGGNGLYQELVTDNRLAIDPFTQTPLGFTIAVQADQAYRTVVGLISFFNGKDIASLNWRLLSIYSLLTEDQQQRLRSAVETNNIPVILEGSP